jgi:hypothetical protein
MIFDVPHMMFMLVGLCALLVFIFAGVFIVRHCYKRHRRQTMVDAIMADVSIVASESGKTLVDWTFRIDAASPSLSTITSSDASTPSVFSSIVAAFTRRSTRGPLLPTTSVGSTPSFASDLTLVGSCPPTPTMSPRASIFVAPPMPTPEMAMTDNMPATLPSYGSLYSVDLNATNSDTDFDFMSYYGSECISNSDSAPSTPVSQSPLPVSTITVRSSTTFYLLDQLAAIDHVGSLGETVDGSSYVSVLSLAIVSVADYAPYSMTIDRHT